MQLRLAGHDHPGQHTGDEAELFALALALAPREADPDPGPVWLVLERVGRDCREAIWQGRPLGHVVCRPPVEDLLDHDIGPVHAVIRGPGAASGRGRQLIDPGDPKLPARADRRVGHERPDHIARGLVDHLEAVTSIALGHHHPAAFELGRPGRPKVVDPAAHLAEVVVAVAVLDHPERGRVDPHGRDAGRAE